MRTDTGTISRVIGQGVVDIDSASSQLFKLVDPKGLSSASKYYRVAMGDVREGSWRTSTVEGFAGYSTEYLTVSVERV